MTQTQHALGGVQQQQLAAKALLNELVAAHREVGTTTAAPTPVRDLFKRVTGHSSLENAIEATRRAIEAYDRMLARNGRSHASPASVRVASEKQPTEGKVADSRSPTIRVTSNGVPSVL